MFSSIAIQCCVSFLDQRYERYYKKRYLVACAGLRSAVDSTSNSRARGPGFDTRSGHILWFLLPLIQEGHLSVTVLKVHVCAGNTG